MFHDLTANVTTLRVMNAVVAGTSDQTSSAIDTRGYQGIRFIVGFGALTGGQATRIYVTQSSDNSGDSYDAIVGSASPATLADGTAQYLGDSDGNKLLITEIFRPTKRYVKLVIDRGTQNAVIDFAIAELYRSSFGAAAQDTTVKAQTILRSPGEGTA